MGGRRTYTLRDLYGAAERHGFKTAEAEGAGAEVLSALDDTTESAAAWILRNYRQSRGFTAEDIGRACGVPPRTVSRWMADPLRMSRPAQTGLLCVALAALEGERYDRRTDPARVGAVLAQAMRGGVAPLAPAEIERHDRAELCAEIYELAEAMPLEKLETLRAVARVFNS